MLISSTGWSEAFAGGVCKGDQHGGTHIAAQRLRDAHTRLALIGRETELIVLSFSFF